MRTPDEIKKGLECCASLDERECEVCPYKPDRVCGTTKNGDALAYIQQLERERDAAVEDMRLATLVGCHVCKYYYQLDPEVRKYACRVHGSFEEHDFISDDGSVFCGAFKWRGIQEVE